MNPRRTTTPPNPSPASRGSARLAHSGSAQSAMLALGFIAIAAIGCDGADDTRVVGALEPGAAAPASSEGTGSLSLPLVTPDAASFRLRGAVFEIERSGVVLASLESDAHPDAEALTAELDPGQYQVRLLDGWSLEELGSAGGATPVRAALVSPNPASFGVRNGRVTTVAFTFTTSSGVVTFGEGAVSVRLGVMDPASLGSCDIVNQAGCPEGQHCLLADAGGKTFCATPGGLPVGAPCSAEQCVFGAQCLGLDLAEPEATTCTALCNPASPGFGCDCRGLGAGDEIGVCGPPPAGTCDLLDLASCPDGLACQFPGGSFGVCGVPGSIGEGASCFGEECEAGLDCFGDDPAFGVAGVCYRFCDVQAPACEFCFEVDTGSVGRCFL
ncbi:MAG TPA: hypothetical protein VMG12_37855 [Polyangiaceae bacterium]|nr:hypothetical protein [Polyangiaceae bacterium]